jgi:hypothetical protein
VDIPGSVEAYSKVGNEKLMPHSKPGSGTRAKSLGVPAIGIVARSKRSWAFSRKSWDSSSVSFLERKNLRKRFELVF